MSELSTPPAVGTPAAVTPAKVGRRKKAPDPRAAAPVVDTLLPYTTAYTDGSSTGAVGDGGWAWAVEGGPEASGFVPDTTNQRVELQAAHEAALALPGLLLIVSDSQYVVRCFTEGWHLGWMKRGWRSSSGKPVANRDLWEPFIETVLSRAGEVRLAWVKGHAGNPMNERVDAMAKAARLSGAAGALTPAAQS